MRVAIASVMQESNSFAPRLSSLSDFQIDVGPELARVYRGTNTEIGGFLEELEALGLETVPLLSAWALAAGPVEETAFEKVCVLLREQIQRAKFDALLIALHGAWLSASHPSADAELIRRIRSQIGSAVPIVATLDFHANVRSDLLRRLWGAVGYRTYPHVDMADTGRKAVRLMRDLLATKKRPDFYWLPVPLILPPQAATTDREPLSKLFADMDEQLKGLDAALASFFCVQPWLDIAETSSSFVVVARSRDPQIPKAIQRAAARLWERRSEFEVEWVSPECLLNKLEGFPAGPVIVSEAYDGTSGGAPGDHPGLLQTLLPNCGRITACLFLVDPVAAQEARRAGSGGEFHGQLGCYFDDRFGRPVHVEGKVRHVSDGVFTLRGPVFTGKKIEMGPTAVLDVGRLSVVVASRAVMTVDPELYRSQGIEPRDRRVVGVKSPSLFRPGFEGILRGVLHLDMPGVCRGNLRKVPFQKINRPIYPLDDFSWDEAREGIWL